MDNIISKSIAVFFATLMILIFALIIKYFRVGFRILLIKLKIVNKNDERSYTEIIGYGIGKFISKITNSK